MSNPISDNLRTGTVGELLTQVLLLQYDVQAAPPLRDSGNDLIALRGRVGRTIQVKTSFTGKIGISKKKMARTFDLLALVSLIGDGNHLDLGATRVYLLWKQEWGQRRVRSFESLAPYQLDSDRVQRCFTPWRG